MWIVLTHGPDPDAIGPFESEDECYAHVARWSLEPNDWTPIEVSPPVGRCTSNCGGLGDRGDRCHSMGCMGVYA